MECVREDMDIINYKYHNNVALKALDSNEFKSSLA